jgi:hypothetical protein
MQTTGGDLEKPKRRRRILGTVGDNPLLRPLEAGNIRTTSSSFLKTPKIQPVLRGKSRSFKSPEETEDDHGVSSLESGLSDFVVNDSYFSEEESDSELRELPLLPKANRKLVRGRRPRQLSEPDSPPSDVCPSAVDDVGRNKQPEKVQKNTLLDRNSFMDKNRKIFDSRNRQESTYKIETGIKSREGSASSHSDESGDILSLYVS